MVGGLSVLRAALLNDFEHHHGQRTGSSTHDGKLPL